MSRLRLQLEARVGLEGNLEVGMASNWLSDIRAMRPHVTENLWRQPYGPDNCLALGDTLKVREVIRLIEKDGWQLVATKGSHRQFKHSTKPGRVTIAGKPSDDMAPGTLNSVFKQAGLNRSN